MITLLIIIGMMWLPSDDSYPSNISTETSLTVQNLAKKWDLTQYRYLIFSEAPSAAEKDDYIHLKSDMTFASVTEGEYDTGQWRLDATAKRIYMTTPTEDGELVLIVSELSAQQLVVTIDDPSDKEIQDLKIYYKNH